MSSLEKFELAVAEVGGQSEMARRLSVTQPHVWNWLNRDKKIPAQYVIPITLIPEVSALPHELRPDVFPAP